MKQTKKLRITPINYILALCLVIGGVIGATLYTRPAAAASCVAPTPSYGSATMQLAVETAGNYRIWTRMQAPDSTNNSVMLEVDGSSCYVVGNTSLPVKAWTWVNHRDANASTTISLALSAGTHTVKVIGTEPSVMIDRILAVADQACTPVALGQNCMATSDTTLPTVTITAPADGGTVAGAVAIKATASDNAAVSKVEFYVQNQLVGTDTTSPYEQSWDTTGKSGAYTITAKAYDSAGNIGTDTLATVVRNGDAQAPTVPTALTANATSHNRVELKWNASTDDVAVKGYRIMRNNLVVATATATVYTDTTVVAGTAYEYRVVAFDASNNTSEASNIVKVSTPNPAVADTQAPTSPAELSATANGTSQVNLTWGASSDEVGIKGYDIYRSRGSDAAVKVATITSTSYGDGSLTPNTTYKYYVIARDAAGNASPASITVSATTAQVVAENQGKSVLRGTIHGRNGRPLSRAKVTLWFNGHRYTASTNWRGRYVISNIPSGRYAVSVRADGYRRSVRTIALSSEKTKWYNVDLRRR